MSYSMPDPRHCPTWTKMSEKEAAEMKKEVESASADGAEAKMKPRPDYGVETWKGLGRLKNKVAVVTGGDSGIGRAVCIAFAREGCDVVVTYHSSDVDAEETAKVIRECGQKCTLIKGDLADPKHCKEIVDKTVAAHGTISILVNNAAFQGKAAEKFVEIEFERVKKTYDTNIIPMFELSRLASEHMKPGSSIINVASIQAYQPSGGILDYASTKGAIVTFTKGLAPMLIKEKGIRVNCVAPGPVWTPLVVASFPPDKIADFGTNYPIGRPAQPKELAGAFVFLASDEASYIVGEILAVTGGKPTA